MVLDAWEFYYLSFLDKNNTNSMLRDNKFISLNINDIVPFRIVLFGYVYMVVEFFTPLPNWVA